MTRQDKTKKLEACYTILNILLIDGEYIDQDEFDNHIRDLRSLLFDIQDVKEEV